MLTELMWVEHMWKLLCYMCGLWQLKKEDRKREKEVQHICMSTLAFATTCAYHDVLGEYTMSWFVYFSCITLTSFLNLYDCGHNIVTCRCGPVNLERNQGASQKMHQSM